MKAPPYLLRFGSHQCDWPVVPLLGLGLLWSVDGALKSTVTKAASCDCVSIGGGQQQCTFTYSGAAMQECGDAGPWTCLRKA